MHKLGKIAVVTNILLALLFVYSNFSLWSFVNAEYPYLIASHWSPLGISAPHYVITDGSFAMVQTVFLYFNFPFWLFFISIAVNLYFILKLSKEAKKDNML